MHQGWREEEEGREAMGRISSDRRRSLVMARWPFAGIDISLRLFFVILMLLLLISPFPPFAAYLAGASSAAPGQPTGDSLTLGGSSGPDISMEVPPSVSDWVLVPRERNERKMALSIRAKDGWMLQVSSDRADGRMAQYDPASSEYVPGGRSLLQPLKIYAPGTSAHPAPWEIELPNAGVIQQMEEVQDDESSVVTVTLQQPVSWEDEPLEDGHVYRIDLIFSVSPRG